MRYFIKLTPIFIESLRSTLCLILLLLYTNGESEDEGKIYLLRCGRYGSKSTKNDRHEVI